MKFYYRSGYHGPPARSAHCIARKAPRIVPGRQHTTLANALHLPLSGYPNGANENPYKKSYRHPASNPEIRPHCGNRRTIYSPATRLNRGTGLSIPGRHLLCLRCKENRLFPTPYESGSFVSSYPHKQANNFSSDS